MKKLINFLIVKIIILKYKGDMCLFFEKASHREKTIVLTHVSNLASEEQNKKMNDAMEHGIDKTRKV